MNTLVTGATGFIGQHVARQWSSLGLRPLGLVRASSQLPNDFAADPVIGDVTDYPSLCTAMRGVDCVIHLAGRVTDWGPWRDFESAIVRGTENALRAAVDSGVRRFVHVSTVAVYDDRHSRQTRVIHEDAPCGPRGDRLHGHYARAKAAAERLVWQFHAAGQLDVTVLRPALVYGPGDRVTIPRLLEYLRSPMAAWIGRKNPTVDPIFVTDAADCIVKAALSECAIGQAYNVAPLTEIGVREFWSALCAAVSIHAPRQTVPYPAVALVTAVAEGWARLIRQTKPCLTTRAGLAIFSEDRHHNASKAHCELNWTPAVSLREGLAATARWLDDSSAARPIAIASAMYS